MTMTWYWLLTVLPFSTILTFILTLFTCSQILHNPRPNGRLPEISLLGINAGYPYFVTGFIVLFVQFLLIIVGRLQFLLLSQVIIYRAIQYIIHGVAFISGIFFLLMVIMDAKHHPYAHRIGAHSMFALLSIYCILHTIVVIYLFINRSRAPEYANIILPVWFLVCSILLVIFFITWSRTEEPIPQYIAATMPCLYILGFIPQFWRRAQLERQKGQLLREMYVYSELQLENVE